jgi:sigma-B regulation protein RsbU (phosphoserine phosphatase)
VHKTGTPPHDVLALLNRRLALRGIPRRYAAIQYALFDPRTKEMNIASAGMPGPFHLSAGGCRLLELPGMPPGLFPAASYESTAIQLKPGDSVLFCTDGLTDATSRDGEQFGMERLHQLCGEAQFDRRAELLQKLFAAVESFSAGCEQKDDMAATLFHLAE